MSCWSHLSAAGSIPSEDLVRAVDVAARRGALGRALEVAALLLVSGSDFEFCTARKWLATLCALPAARKEAAAHAGVLIALRGTLHGARAMPALELLIVLLPKASPQAGGVLAARLIARRQVYDNTGGVADGQCESGSSRVSSGGGGSCGGGGGGGGSGATSIGVGGLGDPGLLSEVVRAAGGANVEVSRAALRFLHKAAGHRVRMWALPLLAPISVAALRKRDNTRTA
jgi:hypothetical protein